jgi:hypothetical protein
MVRMPPSPVMNPAVKFFVVSHWISASMRSPSSAYDSSMRYYCARFSAEESGAVPFTDLSMSHSMSEAASFGAEPDFMGAW